MVATYENKMISIFGHSFINSINTSEDFVEDAPHSKSI